MCTLVASGSPGTHAGVFHDIVLWAEGAGRALQLMDVNKDNDELMDATDWFPLDFLYVFDNDNDGIGNAADIVPAHGSCVQSDKRGACYSDLMVLYLVWAGFVIVLTTSVFFMARWYYRRKLIIRAAAKAPLASSNGVASGGSGRMGQRVTEGSAHGAGASARSITAAVLSSGRRGSDGGGTASRGSLMGDWDVESMTGADAKTEAIVADAAGISDVRAVEGPDPGLRRLVVRTQLVSLVGQIFMLLLAIASLLTAIIPYLSLTPTSLRLLERFSWFDFFTAYIFLVDIVTRFVTRNPEHTPNFRSFLRKNWSDFLALFTDIPGLTTAGALHFLVFTRFRHLFKIFRLARILKIFRVVRAYRNMTRTTAVLDFMINKPHMFMGVLLVLLILAFSAGTKIFEQGSNPVWSSYANNIWFSIVTVTTIGYGDMAPRTIGARVMTVLMMALGIGLVGLLTATVIRGVMVGKQGSKLSKRKREHRNRLEMLKGTSARMCMAFNPLVVSFGEHLERSMGKKLSMVQLAMQHSSAQYNMVAGLDEDVLLPMEELMAQSSTKFSAAGETRELTEAERQHRRTLTSQRRALQTLVERSMSTAIVSPTEKLNYVLRFSKLDSKSEGVRNFDSLLTELQEAMFPAVKPEDTFVGRVLALSLAMDDAGGLPPGVEADLTDPLDRRLVRVEEILKRHQIPGRDNYHELLLELTTLAVLYDRVQNAQYCLQAVQFIPELEAEMYPPAPIRAQADGDVPQFSRTTLVPAFNFVSRRTNLPALESLYRVQARTVASRAKDPRSRLGIQSQAMPLAAVSGAPSHAASTPGVTGTGSIPTDTPRKKRGVLGLRPLGHLSLGIKLRKPRREDSFIVSEAKVKVAGGQPELRWGEGSSRGGVGAWGRANGGDGHEGSRGGRGSGGGYGGDEGEGSQPHASAQASVVARGGGSGGWEGLSERGVGAGSGGRGAGGEVGGSGSGGWEGGGGGGKQRAGSEERGGHPHGRVVHEHRGGEGDKEGGGVRRGGAEEGGGGGGGGASAGAGVGAGGRTDTGSREGVDGYGEGDEGDRRDGGEEEGGDGADTVRAEWAAAAGDLSIGLPGFGMSEAILRHANDGAGMGYLSARSSGHEHGGGRGGE